ncbi:MAG TPA: M15 family peptidase [Gemmatimonadetes bacterium]|nr:M15 family peptidase [Gemmatimonadota bacterium]
MPIGGPLSAFESLTPELRPYAEALQALATQYDPGSIVTSTTRTFEAQQRLRDAYLRGESRFPASAPGRSLHNYGHAFDLVTSNPELQRWLGLVWEYWGGRWGGRFNDAIHFDTGAHI